MISILSVFYGRNDASTCLNGKFNSTTCSSTAALNSVQTLCENHEDCIIQMNSTGIGEDPCSGSTKYTIITYSCVATKNPTRQVSSSISPIRTSLPSMFFHDFLKDTLEFFFEIPNLG